MDIAAILRELDAELERLYAIRVIVSSLEEAAPRSTRRKRTVTQKPAQDAPAVVEQEKKPEPRLVVLPAKMKRQYGPRVRRTVAEPKALAAPISERPVFVPKVQEPT